MLSEVHTPSPLLQIQGLSKVYETPHGGLQALDGVSIEVRKGQTYGLIGESGSGKTTMAKIVSGILAPSAGAVRVMGEEVPHSPRQLRRTRYFEKVQLVFQDTLGTLNPYRTIYQSLQEPLINLGSKDHKSRIHRVIDQVSFPRGKLVSRPGELSGGLRQRVAIARALIVQPCLLILDEPVASLDVSVQAKILNLLQELKKDLELTYFLISHDIDVVQYLSDFVGILYKGRVVEQGSVQRIFSSAQDPYSRLLLEVHSRRYAWAQEV